jgi:hypothetical protein
VGARNRTNRHLTRPFGNDATADSIFDTALAIAETSHASTAWTSRHVGLDDTETTGAARSTLPSTAEVGSSIVEVDGEPVRLTTVEAGQLCRLDPAGVNGRAAPP